MTLKDPTYEPFINHPESGEIGSQPQHPRDKPERLNLAIANDCHVCCRGCYTFFGRRKPNLTAVLSSVAAFVRLGIRAITVSGGDPLTIHDLPDFLRSLRALGVNSIKVDTVGVGLRQSPEAQGDPTRVLRELMSATDFLGIPLDGWSNESVLLFRYGRRDLYVETVALLDMLDQLNGVPRIIINTVLHRSNLSGLDRIGAEVLRHAAVCHWNIFQYTPTDQASADANAQFLVDNDEFARAETAFNSQFKISNAVNVRPSIAFRNSAERLGQYLLVNSDGEAWLPDARGRTVRLGRVFGAEHQVLQRWADAEVALHESECLGTPRVSAFLSETPRWYS